MSAIDDAVRSILTDPMNLPPEFLDYMVQHQAQNILPVGGQSPGTAIAYNIITANVNVTGLTAGTATTIVSSTSKVFDGSQVILEFFSPAVISPAVAAGTISLFLFEAGTAIALLGQIKSPAAANTSVPMLLRYLFAPSSGSHSYTIGGVVSSTTGTPAVAAGAGTGGTTAPAYIRITEA